jgi:hypothetical protein
MRLSPAFLSYQSKKRAEALEGQGWILTGGLAQTNILPMSNCLPGQLHFRFDPPIEPYTH